MLAMGNATPGWSAPLCNLAHGRGLLLRPDRFRVWNIGVASTPFSNICGDDRRILGPVDGSSIAVGPWRRRP